MLPVHRLLARQRRPLVELLLLTRPLSTTNPHCHDVPSLYLLSRTYHISATRPASARCNPTLLILSPSPSRRSLSSSFVLHRSFATSSSTSDPKQPPNNDEQQQQQQQQRAEQDEYKHHHEQGHRLDEDTFDDAQERRARIGRILRTIGVTILLGGSFMAGFHLSSRGAAVHSDRTTPRSYVEVFTDIYDGLHDWITNTLGTSDHSTTAATHARPLQSQTTYTRARTRRRPHTPRLGPLHLTPAAATAVPPRAARRRHTTGLGGGALQQTTADGGGDRHSHHRQERLPCAIVCSTTRPTCATGTSSKTCHASDESALVYW